MRPTFRLVVPTYRRPDLLAGLLNRLAPQLERHPEFHLVVVNDGSHDAAYEQVIAAAPARFTYLKLLENSGVGVARQRGYGGAFEDYLVATDDDCRPPTDWLDRLMAVAMINPHVDLFAGTTHILDPPRGVISREIAYVPNAVPAPVLDGPWLVTAVTANAMYKREVFEQVGGFAEDMRGATEDCYLTRRLIAAGGTWLNVPSLTTGHRAIQTVRELLKKFHGYGYGAGQYVIREQDWLVAGMHPPPAYVAGVTQSWKLAFAQRRKPENRAAGWGRVVLRCGLTLLASLAYQRGWRRGIRHFTRHYGRRIPAPPTLADRYNDFCYEIVLPAHTT